MDKWSRNALKRLFGLAIIEQGDKFSFYATFVDNVGSSAVISGTPTISILHRQGASNDTDLSSSAMSLISGTTYYYVWHPNNRAFKGTYIAKYNAEYTDGIHVVGDEDFQIVSHGHYDKSVGGLVLKGKNGIWTEKEKEKVLNILDSLSKGINSFEDLNSKIDSSKDVLELLKKDIENNTKIDVIDYSDKIDSIVEKVSILCDNVSSKKEEVVFNLDESKICKDITENIKNYKNEDYVKVISMLKDLKIDVKKFDELNENLRIPRIISELEDIRIGFENFQRDLVKMMPTGDIEKGLTK